MIREPVQWLAYGNTAMAAVVIANIWKGVPFNMILLATALTDNQAMRALGRRLGFTETPNPDEPTTVRLSLELQGS